MYPIILSNDTLHSYKKLVAIYLCDNWLLEFDEALFANQHYLKVLDLTRNILFKLPKNFFQFPYLHTLYLGHNMLSDSAFKINPTLIHLDVSYNVITSISTEDLAPFCSLKKLDLTGNRIRFNASSCDCQAFNVWVKLRQIKMKPDLYKCIDPPATLNKDCAKVTFSDRTHKLFNECLAMAQQKMKTAKASIGLKKRRPVRLGVLLPSVVRAQAIP
ncbi:leucine-rich repeat transmembrane neuronal protein 3-like [Nylanderia fulva]|uniref:leucine-rich repeat transmembrane neuronal protein 3-like n=1 Tax=Nylanderia fulva TaxID=613905 RepID=UPI0010FB9C56|nr:leucine-rich repeat transmembrane neuronal protein 3-like [Nylanderia fulva]